MTSTIVELDQALKAVCPVHGVSVGNMATPSTWRINFKTNATPAQRAAATAVLATYTAITEPPDPRIAMRVLIDSASNIAELKQAVKGALNL